MRTHGKVPSEEEFYRTVSAALRMRADLAEGKLLELEALADQVGNRLWVRSCLLQRSILLASWGRERDSLRLCIRLAREYPSASSLVHLAHCLERNSRFSLAQACFQSVLDRYTVASERVDWARIAT